MQWWSGTTDCFWAKNFFKLTSTAFKTDDGCFFVCCVYLVFNLKAVWFKYKNLAAVLVLWTVKTQNSKQEVKKELEESLFNGEKHGNKNIGEKAPKVEKCEDSAAVTREFEDIIRTKKKNIFRSQTSKVKFLNILKKEKSLFLWLKTLDSANRPLDLKWMLLSW